MIDFNEFRKDLEPAFGESEQAYFIRMISEYRRFCKHVSRTQRLNLWLNRINAVTRLLGSKTNPAQTQSA